MAIQAKTVTGASGFSGVHDSGSLSFKATNATTADVDVDFHKQTSLSGNKTLLGTQPVFNLAGDIFLTNGNITGGLISLMVTEPSSAIERYQFNIAPGSGSLHKIPGLNSYLLAGLTYNGLFNGDSFGGVDVSFWHDQQPVLGSFLQFNYNPDTSGYDRNANLDVSVFGESFSRANDVTPDAVPLPQSVWGGLVLAGVMAGLSLRKRANA